MLTRRAAQVLVMAAAVVLGITAGVAHQKTLREGRSDFLTEWTAMLTRPVAVVFHFASDRTAAFVRIFRVNSSLKAENALLRERYDSARSKLVELREYESEAKRLRDLLKMKEALPVRTVAARVVIRPATPWADTCTVDAGSEQGVMPGSAVFTARGLLGQVFRVGRGSSQVLLLTDRSSSVAALVQGSRAPGVCSGQGAPELLMEYIPADAAVRPGDAVVSSGEGGIFPKGVLVGHVVSVESGEDGHFKAAVVAPAVQFRSVEEVLVAVER